MSKGCEVDMDCPLRMVCYDSQTWAPYQGTTNSSCGCESWYGWQGSTCRELSSCTYAEIVVHSVNLLIAFLFLLLGVFECQVRFRAAEPIVVVKTHANGATPLSPGTVSYSSSSSSSSSTTMNATIVTLLLAVGVLVFMCILEALTICLAIDVDTYLLVDGYKQDYLYYPEGVLSLLIVLFAYLGSINLALVWINVASNSRSRPMSTSASARRRGMNIGALCCTFFYKALFAEVHEKLYRMRAYVIGSEIAFIIVVVVCSALNYPWLAIYLGAPFALSICYLHLRGRSQIVQELEKMKDFENFDSHSPQSTSTKSPVTSRDQPSKSQGEPSGGTSFIASLKRSNSSSRPSIYSQLISPITWTSKCLVIEVFIVCVSAQVYASETIDPNRQFPTTCSEKVPVWAEACVLYFSTFSAGTIVLFLFRSRRIFLSARTPSQDKGPPGFFRQNSINTTVSGAPPGPGRDSTMKKEDGKSVQQTKVPRYQMGPEGETVECFDAVDIPGEGGSDFPEGAASGSGSGSGTTSTLRSSGVQFIQSSASEDSKLAIQ